MRSRNELFLTIAMVVAAATNAWCQISGGGTPPSLVFAVSSSNVTTVTLPPLDSELLRAQAEATEEHAQANGVSLPYQVAEVREVNYSLTNSGGWETLPDGSRLWRLRIVSPGAAAVHLIYDRWVIPKRCELFVYSDNYQERFGAYTTPADPTHTSGVTPRMAAEAVTLEYHVQPQVADVGELSVSRLLHHFRFTPPHEEVPVDTFGQSHFCQVNVNCTGGVWNDQRDAVMEIFLPEGGQCTGVLMNNTRVDGNPLVLMANHCYPTGNHSGYLFHWKYQSPTCGNLYPLDTLWSGSAWLQSRWENSDFELVQMWNPPMLNFSPYYAGWDRSGNVPANSRGIHHPRGDIKKYSVDDHNSVHSDWNGQYAGLYWQSDWEIGATEGGSSGSPLFDQNRRVVGQLRGGIFGCANDAPPMGVDKYGKLVSSWLGGGDSGNRLHDYLDPLGGNVIIDGFRPVAPANDQCASATPITNLPYFTSGNTRFGTLQYTNCTNHSTPDVWWQMSPSCSTYVTITTCGSRFDTELQVWAGGSCATFGFQVTCNDDDPGLVCQIDDTPGDSRVQFWTQPGGIYFIQLSGYGAQSGAYNLNVTGVAAVPNDVCPGITVPDLPYEYYGYTTCAANQYIASCAPDNGSPDVVFKWVSPCNMNITATTCGSDFDTILEMWQAPFPGDCNMAMNQYGCNDDALDCPFFQYTSTITRQVYTGEIYYFFINGYNGASGLYRFAIETNVPGDRCQNRITIGALPYSHTGNTTCVGNDYFGCVDTGSGDMVYEYTPLSCHNTRISLCGSGFDTSIRVMTGSCPGTTQVICNDDFCGLQSQLDVGMTGGVTYYIIIAGYQANEGAYTLNVQYLSPYYQPNDLCAGAPLIATLPYSDYGNTLCAGNNYFNCVGTNSNEVVYRLQFPVCTEVNVSLCGSDYDTGLGIYGGVCPNIAPLVICNDDNYCGATFTLQSSASFVAEANTNYQILVHGYSNNYGLYALNVTGTPCVPPDIENLVTQFNVATGDVVLTWSASPGAEQYDVYRSSDFATLYNPGNLIATVTGTSYTCAGCMHEPPLASFFGVIAESTTPGLRMGPPRNLDGLTKADAIQGEVLDLSNWIEPIVTPPSDKVQATN